MSSKVFLDTTVARPLLSAGDQYKSYLKEQLASSDLYVSPFIHMEFKRGLLAVLVQLYFDLQLPIFDTAADVFSYWNNKVSDREVKAVANTLRDLFAKNKVDLNSASHKKQASNLLADYIDRLEMAFEVFFKNTSVDSTRCHRAKIELEIDADDVSNSLKRFNTEFNDTKDCRSKCRVDEFLLSKNLATVKLYVEKKDQLVNDKKKTENKQFVAVAEHLEDILGKGPSACTCRKCGGIGDAIIAMDSPSAMSVKHTDASFNQLCENIGKSHEYLMHEAAYFGTLKADSKPEELIEE